MARNGFKTAGARGRQGRLCCSNEVWDRNRRSSDSCRDDRRCHLSTVLEAGATAQEDVPQEVGFIPSPYHPPPQSRGHFLYLKMKGATLFCCLVVAISIAFSASAAVYVVPMPGDQTYDQGPSALVLDDGRVLVSANVGYLRVPHPGEAWNFYEALRIYTYYPDSKTISDVEWARATGNVDGGLYEIGIGSLTWYKGAPLWFGVMSWKDRYTDPKYGGVTAATINNQHLLTLGILSKHDYAEPIILPRLGDMLWLWVMGPADSQEISLYKLPALPADLDKFPFVTVNSTQVWPYRWRLEDVAYDQDGTLLGLFAIHGCSVDPCAYFQVFRSTDGLQWTPTGQYFGDHLEGSLVSFVRDQRGYAVLPLSVMWCGTPDGGPQAGSEPGDVYKLVVKLQTEPDAPWLPESIKDSYALRRGDRENTVVPVPRGLTSVEDSPPQRIIDRLHGRR